MRISKNRNSRLTNLGRLKEYVALVLLVIFFSAGLYVLSTIKTGKISCKNQYGYCKDDINSKLKSYEGKQIALSYFGLKKQLSAEKELRDFSIQFRFPANFIVTITEKKQEYSVHDLKTGVFYYLDKEGLVISKGTSEIKPSVLVDDIDMQIGVKVDIEFLKALRILKGVGHYHQIADSSLRENYLGVTLVGGQEIVFPLDKDEKVLLGAMNYIFGELNTDGENSIISTVGDAGTVVKLDLRYKNPVLTIK